MLKTIEGKAEGKSGSINYVDPNVQAVHVAFGIPYEATNQFALLVALQHSQIGIQVVQFDDLSVCYGFISSKDQIPTHQKLAKINAMPGVVSVTYFGKDNSMKVGK